MIPSPVPRSAVLLNLARVLLVALAAAQVFDVLSTNAALASSPDAFESNPVMRLAMTSLGAYWWLWKAALAVFFLTYAARIRVINTRGLLLLGLVAKVYVFVILSNIFGFLL